ncbi:MAG TPA: peptidylprolyl isomerase [Acidobacteriota bacterium]|nr:peptidylprolyl isomerase [Acidobacteriota bacterium]
MTRLMPILPFLAALFLAAAFFPLLAQSQEPSEAAQGAPQEDKVVAEMDGYVLTDSDVDRLVQTLGPRAQQQLADPEKRKQFIRSWMEVKALAREAEKAGVDQDEAFQRAIDIRRTQALADYYREKVSQQATVTQEEMETYYQENQELFRHPVMVRLSTILVGSQEEAEKIVADLRGGADFAQIAQVRSKDMRSRDRGGFMGWIRPGQLEAAMEQVAFGLEEGEISDPLRTVRGWHILKVDGKRPPGYLTLDDIRDTLAQQLLQLKRKQEAEQMAREAAEKYHVQLHFEMEEGQKDPEKVPERN